MADEAHWGLRVGPSAAAGGGSEPGSILVTVRDNFFVAIVGRNVTHNGVTTATNGSGQVLFSSITPATGLSVVCATPGAETATWTSTAGTASGSGFTASPITVLTEQQTAVVFTVSGGPPPI